MSWKIATCCALVPLLLLVTTPALAQEPVCKGSPITATGKVSGILANEATLASLKRAALAQLNRNWRDKARSLYGSEYTKVSRGSCKCTRSNSGNRVTVTCVGAAPACRIGQFIATLVRC